MAEIRLRGKYGKGLVAQVDDVDFDRVWMFPWRLTSHGYPKNSTQGYLHHMIMGVPPKGYVIDHIDRDKLNNKQSNLRSIPISENIRNQDFVPGKSGKRGVWRANSKAEKWTAVFRANGKFVSLGTFDTVEEASRVYEDYRRNYGVKIGIDIS